MSWQNVCELIKIMKEFYSFMGHSKAKSIEKKINSFLEKQDLSFDAEKEVSQDQKQMMSKMRDQLYEIEGFFNNLINYKIGQRNSVFRKKSQIVNKLAKAFGVPDFIKHKLEETKQKMEKTEDKYEKLRAKDHIGHLEDELEGMLKKQTKCLSDKLVEVIYMLQDDQSQGKGDGSILTLEAIRKLPKLVVDMEELKDWGFRNVDYLI